MLEGLGKHLLTYACSILRSTGQLIRIDAYVAAMSRCTSATKHTVKKVDGGLSSVGTLSAMDLPGVILQLSMALGNHNSSQLPIKITRRIQRAIYFFFLTAASQGAAWTHPERRGGFQACLRAVHLEHAIRIWSSVQEQL